MDNKNNKAWQKGLNAINEINASYFGSYLDEDSLDEEYQVDSEVEFEISQLTSGIRAIPKRYD